MLMPLMPHFNLKALYVNRVQLHTTAIVLANIGHSFVKIVVLLAGHQNN
jgi:hypothetical protein